ncbi:hypothetical protein SAMN05519104_6697 [Rhizobiales bacterium GAS188]|nr:hypothetical protein SAMN05519104_6697 [Rhizobiales bacterium GAS188]
MKRKSRSELRRAWHKATKGHRGQAKALRAYQAATHAGLRLALGTERKARRSAPRDSQAAGLFGEMHLEGVS